jgi:hypothetical protein
MKNYIHYFIFWIFVGCDKLCDIPALKTNRVPYIGNALRLEGLYYTKDYKSTFFLYRNGILQAACINDAIPAIPDKFNCSLKSDMVASAKKVPYFWGIYRIEHDSIRIETWGTIADCTYDTFLRQGKILNDSTFLMVGMVDRNSMVPDTFHFVAFSPKPDSTNKFIP